MRCPKCRAELEEGTLFCTNCGIEIESYLKWSPDYRKMSKETTASQPEEHSNFGQEEKTADFEDFEAFEESGENEIFEQPEIIERPKWEETENFQKTKLKKPRVLKKSKPGKQKKTSFADAFYRKKEGFHIKEFFQKHFKVIIGAVFMLAAVIFTAQLAYSEFFGPLDNVIAVCDEDDDEHTIYLNNKKVGTVSGIAQIYNNMDRSAFYILDIDSTAWYIKGKKLVKVMEGCMKITVANHNKTALLVGNDQCLYRYNGSKLEKITGQEVYTIAISGNGDYYSYAVSNKGEYDSYIGKEPGKEKRIEKTKIFAISEKGEYFYGLGRKNYLQCINRKGEAEALANTISVDSEDAIMLNENGTEIMYIENDKTYICIKGTKKEKAADYAVSSVYGRETGNGASHIMGLNCTFYPIDTFKKSVGYAGNDRSRVVLLISDSYKAEEIVSNVSELYGTDKKASKIYYEKLGAIYSAKAEEAAEEKRLTEKTDEVIRGYLSSNKERIYFITQDSEIGYVKENGEIEYADIKINKNDCRVVCKIKNSLYIQSNNKFFYINGRRVKELKDIKDLCYDELSGRVYAYTRKQLYELKNGNMKKLKGDFNKIIYVYTQ